MKRSMMLGFLLSCLLVACMAELPLATGTMLPTQTPIPTATTTQKPTVTKTATSTATPTATYIIEEQPYVTSTIDPEAPYRIYQINDFSDDYYGYVQLINTDAWFKEGWIAIYDKQTDKKLIEVKSTNFRFLVRENNFESNDLDLPYEDQEFIIYKDVNFDGNNDFLVHNGNAGCYGGSTFKVYLFSDGNFKYSQSFSELPSSCAFFVDTEKQRIYTMDKSGCCWHAYTEYTVENNVPVIYQLTINDNGVETVYNRVDGLWVYRNEEYLLPEDIELYLLFSVELEDNTKIVITHDYHKKWIYFVLTTKSGLIWKEYPRYQSQEPDILTFDYEENGDDTFLRFTVEEINYEIFQLTQENKVIEIGFRIKTNGNSRTIMGILDTVGRNLRSVQQHQSTLENVKFIQ